ncbi:hypothetical protein ACQJBY_032680 [Aegilops geniculata]
MLSSFPGLYLKHIPIFIFIRILGFIWMVQLKLNVTTKKTKLPLPILLITINNKCHRGGLWPEGRGAALVMDEDQQDLEKPIVTPSHVVKFEVGIPAGTTSTHTSHQDLLSAAVILPAASSPSYALISSSCAGPFIIARRECGVVQSSPSPLMN